jgi:methionyl aminopeptidase
MEKITGIKLAGKAVANILRQLKKEARAGMTGKECEKIAQRLMKENNVQSSTFGYQNFPAYICISINNELTHGIPNDRIFREGDLVSFDVACNYQNYHADAALTMIIGENKNKEKEKLLEVTKNSLYHAIKSIKPNITTTQDIGENLENYITSYGYFPIKEYGGHAIGCSLHEKPFIPNYKTVEKGEVIKEGMFICIEPLVQIGDDKIIISFDK